MTEIKLNADQIVDQIEQLSAVDLNRLQRLIVDKGFTRNFLSDYFHRAVRTVEERTRPLKPIGFRAKAPLFSLAAAAEVLVDPKIDIEQWVKSLRPNDLPTYLQSEFWKAQNNRQKFELEAGGLWRTERVQAVLTDVFKMVSQQIKLMTDNVDQQTGLTIEQRAVVQSISDGLLEEIGMALQEYAGGYAQDDHDLLLAEAAKVGTLTDMRPEDRDMVFDLTDGTGL
jgi:hypothetical protein